MSEPSTYQRSFRFGPIERRGIAGGLRPGQVALLGAAAVLAVAIFRRAPTPTGLFLALSVVALACAGSWVVVAGRQVDEWLPVLASWFWLLAHRQRHYASPLPGQGSHIDLATGLLERGSVALPILAGSELQGVPLDGTRELGVFHDQRAGTFTAVLGVKVRSFGLLAVEEQERRLVRWGRVLASVARDGGAVRRVQLLERTLPHDGDHLQRWLNDHALDEPGTGAAIRRSYEGLIRSAGDVTQDHEVLVAVQVDPRRSRTGLPQAATAIERAHALIVREVRSLAERLASCDAGVIGVCDRDECARIVAQALDPYNARAADGALGAATSSEVDWNRYRTDGAMHRTYWVAQWPRLGVGPAFLAPVFLTQSAVRSFSVVIEPVPPSRARAAVEAALTSDEADEELRRERGFRTTARRRSQQAATQRREAELSEGHEELRFAGYLTVCGRDEDELERHCDEMLQAAQQAYLDLQPMWGQQDTGLVAGAMPLCHGLAHGGRLS